MRRLDVVCVLHITMITANSIVIVSGLNILYCHVIENIKISAYQKHCLALDARISESNKLCLQPHSR